MSNSIYQHTLFPKGEKAPESYFRGTAWVKMLVQNNPSVHCTVGNVVFEPGCRNNWHTHPGGQILICIEGEGYFQEKGMPIRRLQVGDVVEILPNVVHWHGATPAGSFTHIAVGPNAQLGGPDWLEPVTDEEYASFR